MKKWNDSPKKKKKKEETDILDWHFVIIKIGLFN